jgi:hypothetical protein
MRYLAMPIIIGLMVLFACINTTDTDDGVPHDQTTVMGTLLLFVDVWNDCDIDTYKGLLDEDAFTFYFDDSDMGGDIPPSWDYEMEIMAVTNLFDAVGPENIDVQLDLSGVTEPEEGAGTCKVENVPYKVVVHVEEEDYDYLAQEHLDMELARVDGEWIITDWWDIVNSRLLGCETTWGAIKAEF